MSPTQQPYPKYKISALILMATVVTICFQNCAPGGKLSLSSNALVPFSTVTCANSLLQGDWHSKQNGSPEVLSVDANCRFASDYCASQGRIPGVNVRSGNLDMSVAATNGSPGCHPVGPLNCSYTLAADSSNVVLQCDGGLPVTYYSDPAMVP